MIREVATDQRGSASISPACMRRIVGILATLYITYAASSRPESITHTTSRVEQAPKCKPLAESAITTFAKSNTIAK